MLKAFDSLGLIEPLNLEIKLDNGEQHHINSNFTLNQNKLANLSGSELETLHKKGYLRAAYLIIASLGNMQK